MNNFEMPTLICCVCSGNLKESDDPERPPYYCETCNRGWDTLVGNFASSMTAEVKEATAQRDRLADTCRVLLETLEDEYCYVEKLLRYSPKEAKERFKDVVEVKEAKAVLESIYGK